MLTIAFISVLLCELSCISGLHKTLWTHRDGDSLVRRTRVSADIRFLRIVLARIRSLSARPQRQRSHSGWADDLVAVADALGYQEFGVTGWSEGGPWALAAAAYIDPARLRHVSSIAPGSYGAFGDNSAAQYLLKIDALGGTLALRFTPGFRLM